MTVRELINTLESYKDDEEVVIKGDNSGGYVDSIYNTEVGTIRAQYGDDFQAVILVGSQVGMN